MTCSPMIRRAMSALLGVTFTATCVGACGSDRGGFVPSTDPTFDDASAPPDNTPACGRQCALDARSVIDTCTGEVVEACADDLACGAAICQEPCAAAAADRSSNGCDFYFQMPRMEKKWPHSCNATFIVNTSTHPADLTLERGGAAIDISKSVYRTTPGSTALVPHEGPVAPGDSVILFVSDSPTGATQPAEYVRCPEGVTPATLDDMVASKTGIGTSFHMTTNVPVSLTSMFPFGGSASWISSATLVLPVPTWGKEHMIVNGWGASFAGVPSVQIVASEDDTELTIIPVHNILGSSEIAGGAANEPVKYRLGRGQHLQFVQAEELTGSIVVSNKPTTSFGGNSCARISEQSSACDILSQQIPPFEQWGSEYVGVGYRPRAGNEHEPMPYRFVAARDGTRLEYDPAIPPGAPTVMNAGEVATFSHGTGDAFVVRTQDIEHPIYVSAHMTGGGGDILSTSGLNYGGMGDPEFVNVISTGQYSNAYSFYADPSYAENSITVVRRRTNGTFKDVWLECAGTLTNWKPVGTRGDYEFTRVDLSRDSKPGDTFGEGDGARVCQTGLQRMRSEGPFTATLWGWDRWVSYAYPGGTALRKLIETPLVPVVN